MKIQSILFSLLLVNFLHAQEFTSLKSKTQIRGIVEAENELIFYGEGIVWTDKNGEVLHKNRLLKGLPSSSIMDLQLDKKGQAWVLSSKGIGLIRSKDDMVSVFEHEAGGETYQILHIDNKGTVYTSSKNHIYKINPDLSKSIIYSKQGKELDYIKRLLVDSKGNLIFTEYRKLYIVKPSGELISIQPEGRVDFKKLHEFQNGTIAVQAFKQMLHLENDSLVNVLNAHDLVRGLKFYHADFASSDYYALLTNEGNLFINKKGEWTNYVPPTNLRPGNFLDDILLASDGQIWVTMTEEPILHYNGSSWNQRNLVEATSFQKIARKPVLEDGRLITQDTDSKSFYEYKNDAFVKLNINETEFIKDIKSGENGIFYWSTKTGLNKHVKGKSKKLIEGQGAHSFEALPDTMMKCTNKLLNEFKNRKLTDISSQDHYLAGDFKYAKIYQTFKDELILYTNRKRGQLTLYDGKNWTKVIDIEGKKIGSIKNIITNNGKTYLFTEKSGIAQYDESGMKWITGAFDDPNLKRFSNYVCKDGSVWSMDNKGKLHYYKDGKTLVMHEPVRNLYTSIRALINTGEGQYDIYSDRDVVRCVIR